jgi:TolA-binding protein
MMGCTAFMERFEGNDTPPPPPAVQNDGLLDDALSVYQRGDYQRAATLFNAIATATADSNQRLRAQLGEICCRLMLADSPEDAATVRGLWEKLKIDDTGDTWRAEQVLFDPLIARWSLSVVKPSPPVSTVSTPPARQKKMETELTALKKKAEQVSQIQRRLDAVMAENQTLKQKIKALEAIDQNIQKKKTEISAPSE